MKHLSYLEMATKMYIFVICHILNNNGLMAIHMLSI